jgi:polyhydroxybutyrate depolymerase
VLGRLLGIVPIAAVLLSGGCERRTRAESAPAPAASSFSGTLGTADGRTRRYLVHVPPGIDAGARPLVLVLHGGGGTAEGAQTTTFTPAAADRLGVVAVYPEGIAQRVLRRNMATWNGGYCCGQASDQGVDDTSFLIGLLDHLKGRVKFDEKRVYATGISNGGLMAMRLACERPDRIAAISSVAGPGYIAECKQPKPVAVQLIHGTADRCTLHAGGPRCGGCWEQAAEKVTGIPLPERHFPCTSVADQAAFWRKVNGCSERERVTSARGKAKCTEWSECTSGKSVSVCSIDGGGHTWPGGVRGCDEKERGCKAFAEVSGPISHDLDASATMTEFFLRHARN